MRTLLLLIAVLAVQPAKAAVPSEKPTVKRYTGHGVTFLHSASLKVSTHSDIFPMIAISGTNRFGLTILVYPTGFQTKSQLERIAISGYEKSAQRSGNSNSLKKRPYPRLVLGSKCTGTRIEDIWCGKPRVTEFFFAERKDRIVQITLMMPPSNHPQNRIIKQVLESLEMTPPNGIGPPLAGRPSHPTERTDRVLGE